VDADGAVRSAACPRPEINVLGPSTDCGKSRKELQSFDVAAGGIAQLAIPEPIGEIERSAGAETGACVAAVGPPVDFAALAEASSKLLGAPSSLAISAAISGFKTKGVTRYGNGTAVGFPSSTRK